MSGGSMDYVYARISEAAYYVHDKEIKELLKDLSELLHDLEWYESGDYGKDTYLKSLAEFKKKWFKDDRTERLKSYIDESLKVVKEELYALVGDDLGK
jgi:hypothetical protein